MMMANMETPTSVILSLMAGGSLGLIAAPHCFSMCGPLHMAVCLKYKNTVARSITVFNLGRILGYTLIGALCGYFGSFLGKIFVNRGVGMFIPIIVMLYICFNAFRKKGIDADTNGWWSKLLNKGGEKILFPVGMLASLLPCGILYVAFGVAISTANILYGAAIMFAFVFTQTFFMEIAAIVGKGLHSKYETIFNKVFPWFTLLLTIFYIVMLYKKMTK